MDIEAELKLLAKPFPERLVNKKPKPTPEQNNCDYKLKIKCNECGGFHHPQVMHLDYVGHAALTDRLLSVDPRWTWEPMAYSGDGLPSFDSSGGMWIKLTVLGITRIGYGNAKLNTYADVGSREKEVIGDALRNAAMRFGCALELWHKGNLYDQDDGNEAVSAKPFINEPKILPAYTDEKMDENIEAWESAIKSGKHTPESIINTISTKHKLSEDQKKTIRLLGKDDQNGSHLEATKGNVL
jgi:hypothetical protein